VTTLKEDLGSGPEDAGDGQSAATADVPRKGRRWLEGVKGLPALARHHWIFTIALGLSIVPRVISMLGFRPTVLFRLDTFDYLWAAVHVSPNVVNPSGYSLFLWLLRPFHSIYLIVALQHVMGLAIAVMVYAVVLRYGLPAWAATLAALPVLFDPAQMLVEAFVMADLLAMLLMVGAFVLLLTRRSPSVWRSIAAGLLMGVSVTVRPTTLPLVILIPLFLLVRKVGWRRVVAAFGAGVIPVLGYMGWFAAVHGSFNLSNSNGLFLWSRTMTFANCSVIKPPADLVALCPNKQPGALAQPDPSKRRLPKRYLWNHDTWQWQPPSNSFVPDTAAFTTANNQRALRFAIKAIEAQPFAYLGAVGKETVEPFVITNNLRFPGNQPRSSTLTDQNVRYALAALKAYTGSYQGVTEDLGYQYGTRLVSPFSSIILEYQRIVYLPGPVFGLAILVGVAGLCFRRRRTAAAALLLLSSVIIMVLPIAEHEYTYRYVIPAVPLVAIAAALALRKPGRENLP
jgi:hypothetical protein